MTHEEGTALREYQALNSITSLACDLDPQLPCFRVMSVEFMDKQVPSEEQAVDNLSDFLMNFNQA